MQGRNELKQGGEKIILKSGRGEAFSEITFFSLSVINSRLFFPINVKHAEGFNRLCIDIN